MFDKDQVRLAAFSVVPTEEHAKAIKAQLSGDSPLMAFVGMLESEHITYRDAVSKGNFATDEGRLQAIKAQGVMHGLNRAIELLLEFAELKKETEEETENG